MTSTLCLDSASPPDARPLPTAACHALLCWPPTSNHQSPLQLLQLLLQVPLRACRTAPVACSTEPKSRDLPLVSAWCPPARATQGLVLLSRLKTPAKSTSSHSSEAPQGRWVCWSTAGESGWGLRLSPTPCRWDRAVSSAPPIVAHSPPPWLPGPSSNVSWQFLGRLTSAPLCQCLSQHSCY